MMPWRAWVVLYHHLGLLLSGLFILLFLGHVAIGAAVYIKHALEGRREVADRRMGSPVYDGFPHKEAFWKEHQAATAGPVRFEPYVHWRRRPFQGRFIQVDEDGVRRTLKEPAPGAAKVYLYGGSTLWGEGSPDGETIPSHLQRLLGPGYDLYNLGEIGWVAAQELNDLLLRLARGERPQVVIFYDGVNDGFTGLYAPAIPRDPHNLRAWWSRREQAAPRLLDDFLSLTNYGLLYAWLQGPPAAPVRQPSAQEVITLYEGHIRQVRALARDYGFSAHFFWQPNLLSLTRQVEGHEQAIIQASDPRLVEGQRMLHQAAQGRFSDRHGEGIHFLGSLFDQVPGPVYIDHCHTGPAGNARVAEAMADALR